MKLMISNSKPQIANEYFLNFKFDVNKLSLNLIGLTLLAIDLKRANKLLMVLLFFMWFLPCVMAQSKPFNSATLSGFKDLLANINGTFNFPDNFTEVKPPNNNKLPFQYGLKQPDADYEIWFEVNSVKTDWQRYEKSGKQGTNPDSSYLKTASDQAVLMAGSSDFITRTMPQRVLDDYNADEGRSYFITLTGLPDTRHYQYALLIVLQKNHYGNMVVACFTNEKGPAFFRNLGKLRNCFKFNG